MIESKLFTSAKTGATFLGSGLGCGCGFETEIWLAEEPLFELKSKE